MNKMTLRYKLDLGIRIISGILLIFAGATKALQPIQFAFQLQYDYGLPVFPTLFISVILPFVEIAIGILILSERFALIATRTMQILFSCFIAFHAWRIFISDLKLSDCSCFGSLVRLSETHSMLFAIMLLIASFFFECVTYGKGDFSWSVFESYLE